MKNFLYGMLGAAVVVTVYHLAVGVTVYHINSALLESNAHLANGYADPVRVVIYWPQYMAAIDTMNHAWVGLMGDIKETLQECQQHGGNANEKSAK